ncbi:MAG: phosphatase PAP2 family protein [Actinobacteria bacterium]|nr:MAG: phosphatase PAP2 family protein [Actinomycetota bacterium]
MSLRRSAPLDAFPPWRRGVIRLRSAIVRGAAFHASSRPHPGCGRFRIHRDAHCVALSATVGRFSCSRVRGGAKSGRSRRETSFPASQGRAEIRPARSDRPGVDARHGPDDQRRRRPRSPCLPRTDERTPEPARSERRELGVRSSLRRIDARPPGHHAIRIDHDDRRSRRRRRGDRDVPYAQRLDSALPRHRPRRRRDSHALDQGPRQPGARPSFDPAAVAGLGPSFPSGHSATAAAFYAGAALLLGRRRGHAARAALTGLAVGIAVAVASSRVLLDVHWLSDVIAGLLLGWAWFAVSAIAFGGRLLRFGAPAEAAVATAAAGPGPSNRARFGGVSGSGRHSRGRRSGVT